MGAAQGDLAGGEIVEQSSGAFHLCEVGVISASLQSVVSDQNND
jgi:hypothetical protein